MAVGSSLPFQAFSTVTLAASTVATSALLPPPGASLLVENTSGGIAFVRVGITAAGTAATLADFPVPPGAARVIDVGIVASAVSVILSSGVGNVYVSRGEGIRAVFGDYPGSTLDLQFLGGVVDQRLTFTRGGSGTYYDTTGTLQTAGTNVPRFYHSSTAGGPISGLLIEASRTNYLLNSGSPATQTTGNLPVGDYTLWLLGSGSATVAAGTAVCTGLGTATSAAPLGFSVTTLGTVTVTVSGTVTSFQLENSTGFATSYIPTTASPGTRAFDNVTMPVGGWFNPSVGTLFCDFIPTGKNNGPGSSIAAFTGSNFDTDFISLQVNQLNLGTLAAADISGADVGHTSTYNITIGAVNKAVMTYNVSAGTMSFTLNGQTVLTNALSGLPTMTTLKLFGQVHYQAPQNGIARRLVYFPYAKSTAEQIDLTR